MLQFFKVALKRKIEIQYRQDLEKLLKRQKNQYLRWEKIAFEEMPIGRNTVQWDLLSTIARGN